MKTPEVPKNEAERLSKLYSYNLLDTPDEEEFDAITKIAAKICDTPISLITLIDEKRQYFKSKFGLHIKEIPREFSFCAHAINTPDTPFIIEDTSQDLRFNDNPHAKSEFGLCFYVGIPINIEGFALGTLCVLDKTPKKLSPEQIESLQLLTLQVVKLIELKKKNELLRQKKQKIEALAKELEEFVYAASHDLKEPLRMMKSFMKLLEKGYSEKLDDTAKKYIHFAVDGSERMEVLINELLHFYQAGQSEIIKEPVDLNEIIDEIEQLHRKDLMGKDVKIERLNLGLIKTSKITVLTILRNLIANAIKFQNDNLTPKINVALSENRTHWVIAVSDNGIGIEKTHQKTIFTIFKKLHRKEEYPGSGIGLAVCKKLVARLNGDIWVESDGINGSIFYFSINKSF
ncbi:MAG: sensor histidine kinase [Flavobacteriales bacterium]